MAKHPSPSASSPARNSPRPQPAEPAKDLPGTAASSSSSPAGYIFMCSGATKPECFRYRVLGLPRGRLDDVSRIRRGAGLFLYDFDAKHLYGPYRADSDGGLALEPAAFQGRYPAQVKFMIDGDFMPIPESSLRSAIQENYSRGKFRPELSFTQVEKLRALFRPITSMPESAPPSYVDDRHPAPSATYLPPSASHQIQPPVYVHPPTTYVHPPTAHLVPCDPYARPYSHLALPTAELNTPRYSVTTTGRPYQAGYEAYGPFPATYQYAQEPPLCYVPAPVYSTASYFAAHGTDPCQSQYQETMPQSTAYGAAHEVVTTNLHLVRNYGSTPSNEIAAPDAAVMNLGLVRSYGSVPSSAAAGTAQANADGAASATYYNSGAGTTQYNADGAASAIFYYAGASATYTQAQSFAAPAVAAAPAYL